MAAITISQYKIKRTKQNKQTKSMSLITVNRKIKHKHKTFNLTLVRTPIIKDHRLAGLNNRYFFSYNSGE